MPQPREQTDQLSAATSAYERLLGPDVLEFPLTPLDTVGVPVWSIWSGGAGTGTGGIGYGTTPERARIGALGECAEHVCATRALAGQVPEAGSLAQMRTRHGADGVVDPRRLGLPAGVPFDDDRPLTWLPMRRLSDGSEVFAPAELVASSAEELPAGPPPGGWLTTPVTNGLGAGSSFDQAVSHAVLEILQRDGNGLRFRALDAGVVLDLQGMRDPQTTTALDALRSAGVEVIAKLGATDFGIPNVYVVGAGPDDDVLSATACGEAVHPDREVALRKAVLEFASARSRKQLMHGPLPAVRRIAPPAYERVIEAMDPAAEEAWVLDVMVDWLRRPEEHWRRVGSTVLRQASVVAFEALPTQAVEAPDLSRHVVGRLAAEGFEVLVRDLSPRSEHSGVHAVKALVPGLEVETVAYQRIGERNAARLLAEGRDDLLRVSPFAPEGWAGVHLTDDGRERLGGPAWLNTRALAALADGFLPLYREPSRHTAQKVLTGER